MPDRLDQLLAKAGLVDQPELDRAIAAGLAQDERLGTILVRTGAISDETLADLISDLSGFERARASDFPEYPVPLESVAPGFLDRSGVVPLSAEGSEIRLAMADPSDQFAIDAIELATHCTVRPLVAAEREIQRAIERLYQDEQQSFAEIIEDIEALDPPNGTDDPERLRDMASEAPIIRLVNHIFADAIREHASDIHIEPESGGLFLRFRIDGLLKHVDPPPSHLAPAIASRIKIMAKLDIAERRRPQDGRIRLRVRGKEVDLRVSIVPSLHGEGVVIRILERDTVALTFEGLGVPGDMQGKLEAVLGYRHGILLVTGPTGSGKTTTIYAALKTLTAPERKIITVEDPVEYQLDGVSQIQVEPDISVTFATILRSILRQNPDVLLVGEMRDSETAELAVQAALTGHVVFSTLHTNDAASALPRLLDMGIEDYLIASSLNAVVSQRLVRKLCRQCCTTYDAPDSVIERFDLAGRAGHGQPILLQRAVGCEACSGQGYKGRTGIYELLPVSDKIRQLVYERADSVSIHRQAILEGMRTMLDDGLDKALQGITTIEEVTQVTRNDQA